jgi:hypothetical protein
MTNAPNIAMGAQAAIAPSTSGQYTTSSVQPPMQQQQRTARHKKKKKASGGGIPKINQYLAGDTTYQDQRSQLMKQLEQFQNSNRSQQNMVGQDFQTALDKMVRQKQQDETNMTGDYGARGMLNSGLFTKAVGDYDTGYQSNVNDLQTGRQRSLSDLLESLANYQTENKSSLLSAKQDAIRRRAQRYGITV